MSKAIKPRKKETRAGSPCGFAEDHLLGSTVLGERGQVVIPKEIRDRLQLTSGAKLLVIQHKHGPIALIPVDQMRHVLAHMTKQVSELLDQS
jgi:AbrB family looped-hinge helix DNA binding protein